jgi:hypothetical protein
MLKKLAMVILLLVLVGLLGLNEVQAQSIHLWAIEATANSEYSSDSPSPLTELEALLTRLEGVIRRATEGNSANPAFLRDLESILRELQSISDELYGELGTSTSQWGEY